MASIITAKAPSDDEFDSDTEEEQMFPDGCIVENVTTNLQDLLGSGASASVFAGSLQPSGVGENKNHADPGIAVKSPASDSKSSPQSVATNSASGEQSPGDGKCTAVLCTRVAVKRAHPLFLIPDKHGHRPFVKAMARSLKHFADLPRCETLVECHGAADIAAGGKFDSAPGLVVEQLSLSLHDAVQSGGTLPWPTLVDIMHDMACALSHLHANNHCHRAVSDRCIMLTGSSEPSQVTAKLGGAIERHTFQDRLPHIASRLKRFPSFFAFAAPEAIDPPLRGGRSKPGTLPQDAPADVYALGSVMLSAILRHETPYVPEAFLWRPGSTGCDMWVNEQHEARQCQLPNLYRDCECKELANIVRRCLQRKERTRPKAAELLEQLGALRSGEEYKAAGGIHYPRSESNAGQTDQIDMSSADNDREAKITGDADVPPAEQLYDTALLGETTQNTDNDVPELFRQEPSSGDVAPERATQEINPEDDAVDTTDGPIPADAEGDADGYDITPETPSSPLAVNTEREDLHLETADDNAVDPTNFHSNHLIEQPELPAAETTSTNSNGSDTERSLPVIDFAHEENIAGVTVLVDDVEAESAAGEVSPSAILDIPARADDASSLATRDSSAPECDIHTVSFEPVRRPVVRYSTFDALHDQITLAKSLAASLQADLRAVSEISLRNTESMLDEASRCVVADDSWSSHRQKLHIDHASPAHIPSLASNTIGMDIEQSGPAQRPEELNHHLSEVSSVSMDGVAIPGDGPCRQTDQHSPTNVGTMFDHPADMGALPAYSKADTSKQGVAVCPTSDSESHAELSVGLQLSPEYLSLSNSHSNDSVLEATGDCMPEQSPSDRVQTHVYGDSEPEDDFSGRMLEQTSGDMTLGVGDVEQQQEERPIEPIAVYGGYDQHSTEYSVLTPVPAAVLNRPTAEQSTSSNATACSRPLDSVNDTPNRPDRCAPRDRITLPTAQLIESTSATRRPHFAGGKSVCRDPDIAETMTYMMDVLEASSDVAEEMVEQAVVIVTSGLKDEFKSIHAPAAPGDHRFPLLMAVREKVSAAGAPTELHRSDARPSSFCPQGHIQAPMPWKMQPNQKVCSQSAIPIVPPLTFTGRPSEYNWSAAPFVRDFTAEAVADVLEEANMAAIKLCLFGTQPPWTCDAKSDHSGSMDPGETPSAVALQDAGTTALSRNDHLSLAQSYSKDTTLPVHGQDEYINPRRLSSQMQQHSGDNSGSERSPKTGSGFKRLLHKLHMDGKVGPPLPACVVSETENTMVNVLDIVEASLDVAEEMFANAVQLHNTHCKGGCAFNGPSPTFLLGAIGSGQSAGLPVTMTSWDIPRKAGSPCQEQLCETTYRHSTLLSTTSGTSDGSSTEFVLAKPLLGEDNGNESSTSGNCIPERKPGIVKDADDHSIQYIPRSQAVLSELNENAGDETKHHGWPRMEIFTELAEEIIANAVEIYSATLMDTSDDGPLESHSGLYVNAGRKSVYAIPARQDMTVTIDQRERPAATILGSFDMTLYTSLADELITNAVSDSLRYETIFNTGGNVIASIREAVAIDQGEPAAATVPSSIDMTFYTSLADELITNAVSDSIRYETIFNTGGNVIASIREAVAIDQGEPAAATVPGSIDMTFYTSLADELITNAVSDSLRYETVLNTGGNVIASIPELQEAASTLEEEEALQATSSYTNSTGIFINIAEDLIATAVDRHNNCLREEAVQCGVSMEPSTSTPEEVRRLRKSARSAVVSSRPGQQDVASTPDQNQVLSATRHSTDFMETFTSAAEELIANATGNHGTTGKDKSNLERNPSAFNKRVNRSAELDNIGTSPEKRGTALDNDRTEAPPSTTGTLPMEIFTELVEELIAHAVDMESNCLLNDCQSTMLTNSGDNSAIKSAGSHSPANHMSDIRDPIQQDLSLLPPVGSALCEGSDSPENGGIRNAADIPMNKDNQVPDNHATRHSSQLGFDEHENSFPVGTDYREEKQARKSHASQGNARLFSRPGHNLSTYGARSIEEQLKAVSQKQERLADVLNSVASTLETLQPYRDVKQNTVRADIDVISERAVGHLIYSRSLEWAETAPIGIASTLRRSGVGVGEGWGVGVEKECTNGSRPSHNLVKCSLLTGYAIQLT